MKYTIPQILKFTAMVHATEMSKIGGRSGYLLNDKRKHLSGNTYLGYPFAVFAVIIAGSVLIAFKTGLFWGEHGFIGNIATLATATTFIAISLIGYYYEVRRNQDVKVMQREKALKYEPEALWSVNYPEHLGKKADMIRSLLGARSISRKMTEDTSIPMDNATVDNRIVHLVKEIVACQGNDIHPYLIDETKSFCKQTIKDFNFYAPLINLQAELAKIPAPNTGLAS